VKKNRLGLAALSVVLIGVFALIASWPHGGKQRSVTGQVPTVNRFCPSLPTISPSQLRAAVLADAANRESREEAYHVTGSYPPDPPQPSYTADEKIFHENNCDFPGDTYTGKPDDPVLAAKEALPPDFVWCVGGADAAGSVDSVPVDVNSGDPCPGKFTTPQQIAEATNVISLVSTSSATTTQIVPITTGTPITTAVATTTVPTTVTVTAAPTTATPTTAGPTTVATTITTAGPTSAPPTVAPTSTVIATTTAPSVTTQVTTTVVPTTTARITTTTVAPTTTAKTTTTIVATSTTVVATTTTTPKTTTTGVATSTTVRPTTTIVAATTSLATTTTRPLGGGLSFAVFASGSSADAVSVSGSGAVLSGPVQSNGGVVVRGAGHTLSGGVAYVSSLDVAGAGSKVLPAGVKGTAKSVSTNLVPAYAPGSPNALAAAKFTQIPASACVNGVWTPKVSELTGVVYVPCSVAVSGANINVTVTLVATGSVTVSGAGSILAPSVNGASIIAGGDVTLSGAQQRVSGLVASAGATKVNGAGASVKCVAAASAAFSGAGVAMPGVCTL
jgi:hypothetical protein